MRTRTSAPARWLAAPAAAAIFVLGVWVAGGLVTDDYRASMALTAAWFATAGVASLRLVRRDRRTGVPALAGFAVAAAAVATYLGLSTLRDRVVDERIAVGMPASRVAAAPGATPSARRNVEQAAGAFRSAEHETSGTARLVRLADGRRVLTLTDFATSAGPDLRVRVARAASTNGSDATDLGALKGNRGNQQYELPRSVRTGGGTVLIWCRAFSALFGSARLRAS